MNKENLANAFINGSLSSGATSVDLKAGYVTYQPTTPYFATITPFGELSTKANSEIVEVTNKSGDTLTIVRGQRGTTAKSFSDGAIFSNGIYVEDLSSLAASINTKENSANKSTSTSLGTSNILFPTQNAVKAYVDNKVSTDWWEELGAANLTGTSTTVSVSQRRFMRVMVVATTGASTAGQLRLRANSAQFDGLVVNLGSTYTAGEFTNADYFWNGGLSTNEPLQAEASIVTGYVRSQYFTTSGRKSAIRYSSSQMTTTATITSITASLFGANGNFSGGRIVVLGHN